jgi:hypothetical protein
MNPIYIRNHTNPRPVVNHMIPLHIMNHMKGVDIINLKNPQTLFTECPFWKPVIFQDTPRPPWELYPLIHKLSNCFCRTFTLAFIFLASASTSNQRSNRKHVLSFSLSHWVENPARHFLKNFVCRAADGLKVNSYLSVLIYQRWHFFFVTCLHI